MVEWCQQGVPLIFFQRYFGPYITVVALMRRGRYHFGQTHEQASVVSHKKKPPSWQHFHGRHKLAAKTSAVWRSGSLVTHLVPHEGMPIVCKTAKMHWRKKMKKKDMKLNELSALQRKIKGNLQHVGTLWFRDTTTSHFFLTITSTRTASSHPQPSS